MLAIQKRFAKMLSSAVLAAGGEVSFEWLRETRGLVDAEEEEDIVAPQGDDSGAASRGSKESGKRRLFNRSTSGKFDF
jgi:hypothetical protein